MEDEADLDGPETERESLVGLTEKEANARIYSFAALEYTRAKTRIELDEYAKQRSLTPDALHAWVVKDLGVPPSRAYCGRLSREECYRLRDAIRRFAPRDAEKETP